MTRRSCVGDELKAVLTEKYNRNEKLVKGLGIKPKESEEKKRNRRAHGSLHQAIVFRMCHPVFQRLLYQLEAFSRAF